MLEWISRLLRPTPEADFPAPESPRPPSRRTLERAMSILSQEVHDLRTFAGSSWKRIQPVGAYPHIMGWGFLEGRQDALVVDDRLAVCLFDDDMDVTSVCVLIDGTPSIEIERRLRRTTIRILEEGVSFRDQATRRDTMPFDTFEDLEALPPAVRTVLGAVLVEIDRIGRRRDAQATAADRILSYGNPYSRNS